MSISINAENTLQDNRHTLEVSRIAGMTVAYALLHLLSLKISSYENIGNIVWLPSGIAITGLLIYGIRLWPGIFLGAFTGSALSGDPALTSIVSAVGNTLDPILACWLLTRFVKGFDIKLEHVEDMGKLIFYAGAVSPILNAVIGVPAFLISESIQFENFIPMLISWWMSIFLGVIMLAPLLLMLATRPLKTLGVSKYPAEYLLLVFTTLILKWLSWQEWGYGLDNVINFLIIIPPLVWSASRLGQRCTAILALLLFASDIIFYYQSSIPLTLNYIQNGWVIWISNTLVWLCSQYLAVSFNEHKKMIDDFHVSEDRLQRSQFYGGIGTWEADLRNNLQYWSKNCKSMLGFPETSQPTWEAFMDAIYPDDRELVRTAHFAHIEDGLPYDVVYRIVSDKGQLRWMRSVGQVEYDLTGKPLRMMGVVQDVTNAFVLDQRLNENESRYRDLVENASDAILVFDLDGNLEEINHAGEILLGYSKVEIRGMQVQQIHPKGILDFVNQQYLNIAGGNKLKNFETNVQCKNGEILEVEIRPTLIDLGQRKVIRGIFIDITERKLQEKEKQEAQNRQRDILVREVHHRIKNHLQGVSGVFYQYIEQYPHLAEPLEHAISQVKSVAVVYGLQGRDTQTKAYLCELTSAIAKENELLWQTPVNIISTKQLIPCQILESEAVPLALILNELISNAIKHGDKANGISISCHQDTSINKTVIKIFNSGRLPAGFNFKHLNSSGTGLKLVLSLLPKNNAHITWEQQDDMVITQLELMPPILTFELVEGGRNEF